MQHNSSDKKTNTIYSYLSTTKTFFTSHLIGFPGFCKPYKTSLDVFTTILTPVLAPLFFGVITAICAAVTALAASVCIGAFLVGCGARLFNHPEFGSQFFELARRSALVTAVSLGCTVLSAMLTPVSILLSPVYIATRTGASIKSGITSMLGSLMPGHG